MDVIALITAIAALFVAGGDWFINWRNRVDSKSLSFVLTGAMRRPKDAEYGEEMNRIWTLHNAGEVTAPNPRVEVEGESPWPIMHFIGAGIVPPAGSLQIVPVGDYPAPDYQGGSYWINRPAVVKWTTPKGKERSAPASVSYSYI